MVSAKGPGTCIVYTIGQYSHIGTPLDALYRYLDPLGAGLQSKDRTSLNRPEAEGNSSYHSKDLLLGGANNVVGIVEGASLSPTGIAGFLKLAVLYSR